MTEFKVHIDKESYAWTTRIHIRRTEGNGRFFDAKEITNGHILWEEKEPGQIYEPLISIEVNEEGAGILQALAEELARLGVMPKPPESDGKELKATKSHLEDMRTISFHKLGIKEK